MKIMVFLLRVLTQHIYILACGRLHLLGTLKIWICILSIICILEPLKHGKYACDTSYFFHYIIYFICKFEPQLLGLMRYGKFLVFVKLQFFWFGNILKTLTLFTISFDVLHKKAFF